MATVMNFVTRKDFIKPLLISVFSFSLLYLNGCSNQQCNNIPQRPVASEPPSPTPSDLDSTTTGTAGLTAMDKKSLGEEMGDGPQIQVSKPSGELQCGQSAGISIQDAAKELSKNKITVIESHSQPDGLMHMTVCGASTGKIHVFTIFKKNIKKAQRLGFKVLATHG
jgi:hypothetical protein